MKYTYYKSGLYHDGKQIIWRKSEFGYEYYTKYGWYFASWLGDCHNLKRISKKELFLALL